MKKLIEFITNIFSSNSDVSSKRVFGALGFVCSIIFIGIWKRDMISELMLTSAALLGLGILDRFNKPNTPSL